MRTIQNLFIAYFFEYQNAIPHEITFKVLEAFDDSEALLKFNKEKEKSFKSTKKIYASTINDAIKAIEDIANSFIDTNLPMEEKEKQKAQNKMVGEQVKNGCYKSLQKQGISIVL